MTSLVVALVSFLFLSVRANVEKIIFVAPDPVTLPTDASIDNLLLTPLTPDHLTYRTHVNASFSTKEKPHGEDTWLLLEGLTPGQRYEFRVCWLAIEPTSFWLYIHPLSSVFKSSDLITSMSSYSYARHAQLNEVAITDLHQRRHVRLEDKGTSLLLLQIQAMADYFTLNRTLMEHVPAVHVDLILDPYLLNVFPQSLVPTAVYIAIVTILAWFLSGWAYRRLTNYVAAHHQVQSGRANKVK